MNWTGGRLRRHSQINSKTRKQTFGNTSAASKGHAPHQITLFNSFAKQQDEKKRGRIKRSTGNPENRTVESIQQASSNTSTNAATKSPNNRLERIKRQLLETADWAAVSVTRPIQVAFPQEEEIERFGKRRRPTRDDYERLNQSATMPGRPLRLVDEANALSDGGPVINPGDGFFPVGIEDFTEANTNPYYPLRDPRRVSSQPMLLENESLDVNNGVGMQSSLPSTHGVARNASSLSRSSGGLQRRGDRVTTTNPVRMNGEPYISARQWLDQGHAMEASQSNRSSSIVPEPESTVRRRFTIDDQIRDAQAFVDRQRRLPASSSSTFSQLVGQGQIEPERPPRMFPGGPPLGIPATLFRPAPQTNGDLDNMTRLSVPGQTFQLLSQFPPSNPSPRPLSSQRPGAVARALTSGQGRLEGPVFGDANESLNVDMNGEADSGEQSDGDNVNDDFYQAYLNL